MSDPIKILVTGARDWKDETAIEIGLTDACRRFPLLQSNFRPLKLVHGGAVGADAMASIIWAKWVLTYDPLFEPAEKHPASDFPDPKQRNAHMVKLGADLCIAFALSYYSGTGNCARLARKAGIQTIDFGVSTK